MPARREIGKALIDIADFGIDRALWIGTPEGSHWRHEIVGRDLLDALGIDSAHICGRSMGGVIAQMLAANYPEKVKTLTIIMSTTGSRKLPMPSMKVLKHMLIKKIQSFCRSR